MWYAVLMDRYDEDWGTGSHDYAEAVRMGQKMNADEIAVIEEGKDPCCVDVISWAYYRTDRDYHACAVPAFALIRGLMDEPDGVPLPETEEVVFWATWADVYGDEEADDADEALYWFLHDALGGRVPDIMNY